jgi:hypothetical protein
LRKEVPHVHFVVHSTVSVLNAFHMPVAIDRWFDLGMIQEADQLRVIPLLGPEHLGFRTLNGDERKALREVYRRFLEEKAPRYPSELREHVASELQKVLAMFEEPFDPSLRQLLRRAVFTLDRLRKERFVSAHPELISVLYGEQGAS